MLVFSVSLSLLLADRAGRKATPAAYALAGGAFALAFLTKVTAVLVAPAMVALALHSDRQALAPRKLGAALAASVPPCLAWVAVLRALNGQWLPSAVPTAEMMQRYPFAAMAVGRPWHFLFSSLLLSAPVFALALLRIRARDARDLGPALCALRVAPVNDDFGPFAGQCARNRFADTAAAPGDQGPLAAQIQIEHRDRSLLEVANWDARARTGHYTLFGAVLTRR